MFWQSRDGFIRFCPSTAPHCLQHLWCTTLTASSNLDHVWPNFKAKSSLKKGLFYPFRRRNKPHAFAPISMMEHTGLGQKLWSTEVTEKWCVECVSCWKIPQSNEEGLGFLVIFFTKFTYSWEESFPGTVPFGKQIFFRGCICCACFWWVFGPCIWNCIFLLQSFSENPMARKKRAN